MKVKIALCLLTALVLTGCSKLNKENYDKLKMGMSKDEVSSVIGAADNCSKTMGAVSCVWGNEEAKHVKIVFMGDKAVTFSYDGLE
ncbi:DUF3862 domain-containing protein [Alteromonas sp. KS69]|jgi:hypothetical protein|uniref:DUF3862 domain-containing protein n=1 Tax=unclassified Alteromonas TaxID=2614992 RepID=UPI000F883982|nr:MULTISPECIES: DUF3862 domain-containing protein [unclassified Alteromonas]MBO7921636.1 DUF3862 domain-containing protein [Alteromonas sp. K632G]RUP76182.1 DUF3862 domain-containing protein [Alteromonas sp. KS69]